MSSDALRLESRERCISRRTEIGEDVREWATRALETQLFQFFTGMRGTARRLLVKRVEIADDLSRFVLDFDEFGCGLQPLHSGPIKSKVCHEDVPEAKDTLYQ